MTAKYLLTLATILCISCLSSAQSRFESKFFGFSISLPQGWHNVDSTTNAENLNSYSFSPEQLDKIMETRHGSVPLVAMMKRRPEASSGIIPTIKIAARKTQTADYEQLLMNMKTSIESTFIKINGFKYIVPFGVTTINGVKVIRGAISYTLPQGDKELQARTYFYFFLGKGFFVQVSFSDSGEAEDESKLFEGLRDSVRFTGAL